ncbi:integrator complex subunit 3 homolog isoform X5 [Drosophila elegans]|uniref:integrator complex subunit 3 homolog isoform X5 n=1 Tax=Drosophila elegans TaxID=30023 RepID=UPI001BC82E47|nr:integrator complex subunit 3 homolog isoform X5 [Drosophila elegans]
MKTLHIRQEMDQPQKSAPHVSKLFVCTAVDCKDEIEEKFERSFINLQLQIVGLSDKEMHDILSQIVCKDKQHEEISIGFLYIMLTDPVMAPKTYRDVTLVSRDGMNVIVANLTLLVAEKYTKLTEIARRQLIWVLREFVKHQVLSVENVIWNCLRQAGGGDASHRNLFLIESLLDIFIEYRTWLEGNPFLVQSTVYSFVRLIEDHANPALMPLRQKEVKFIISLIRERFHDVIPLGRDFVRFWCQRYEEKLSEIIASLLTSKYPSSSPNKRKRPSKGNIVASSTPSADQVLYHLEHYRRSCRHGTGTGLYVHDMMQRALQSAHSHSNEVTKKQFSDLFALAAEDDTTAVGRRGGSGRGRKQPVGKKDVNNHSTTNKKNSEMMKTIYSSDENFSEEDWSKPKMAQVAKKRKKAINDSD